MKYEPKLYKLSNGITVILDPMDLETTIVKVAFKTGSRDEKPYEYGLTHFCEHMLCKGTKRFPDKKIIDDYMELHGGFVNAGTGNSMLSFRGKILAENLNVLVDYIGDQLQNSLFDENKIEIERKVVIDELRRAMDDPDEQLRDFISNRLFNGAAASYKTLGTVENIMSFTRQQMLEFLNNRLSASNCVICISGKILDKDELLKCLEKTFQFLKPFNVIENNEIHYTPLIAHNLKLDQQNVKLRMYFPDVWPQTYEYLFQQKCLDKFEIFLNKSLYRVLRHENGFVYGFGRTSVGNEILNLNGFATETAPEHIESVVALIAKNSYKIYNENLITEDDLERYRCKNKLFNAEWLESSGSRSQALISFYFEFAKIFDFYESVRINESIKVDDVIQNSRGYFEGPMSIVTQGEDFKSDLRSVWVENFK